MKPRWHILLGLVFTLLLWLVIPKISIFYLSLVFLSSVLIDFDHYAVAAFKTKKMDIFRIFEYHEKELKKIMAKRKRGIREKWHFHIFHTVEFHILIAVLSYFWTPFLFVLIGMVFHSFTDLIYLIYTDRLYLREYFFINWWIRMKKS